MSYIIGFINYVIQNQTQIIDLLLEHISLTTIAVFLSIIIGVPIGILISYIKKLSNPVLGVASVIQAIPSMALLGFAIPLFGIGTLPAIIIVLLYSLLPILKNTYTGLSNINEQTIEAARGIGLTKFQILFKIKIPLALPVIMAGVRISAVTAVGLMTMGAFIGAGGLGNLVFAGIRTVTPYQILAGAIPACLLALTVDFLLSILEKLVTPISLQKSESQSIEQVKRTRRNQKGILSVSMIIIAALLVSSAIPRGTTSDKVIHIGSKDFTEQLIVANIVADMIEAKTDINVIRDTNLGGTQVCIGAIQTDEIDLYIDYTGTLYTNLLEHAPSSDIDQVYNTVKQEMKEKYDIEVLDQMGFNNTYTLAVKPELAQEYNIKTISDLAKHSDKLVVTATLEFLARADAMPGLIKAYDLNFKKEIGIDGSPRYIALENGNADVVDAFATDGLIRKFGLVVLEDDKHYFPPYYAIPLVRSEIIELYPEIVTVLNDLGPILTDEIMTELNYKVDELQMQPEDVARTFLVEQGLIQ